MDSYFDDTKFSVWLVRSIICIYFIDFSLHNFWLNLHNNTVWEYLKWIEKNYFFKNVVRCMPTWRWVSLQRQFHDLFRWLEYPSKTSYRINNVSLISIFPFSCSYGSTTKVDEDEYPFSKSWMISKKLRKTVYHEAQIFSQQRS